MRATTYAEEIDIDVRLVGNLSFKDIWGYFSTFELDFLPRNCYILPYRRGDPKLDGMFD